MKHETVTVAMITVFCEFESALLVVTPLLEPTVVGSDIVVISGEIAGIAFAPLSLEFIPDIAIPEFSAVALLKFMSPFQRLINAMITL